LYEARDIRKLLVIPKGMQKVLINKAREILCHFGTNKVIELLNREYSISNLGENVERFIRNCVPCIMVNRKRGLFTNAPCGYKNIFAVIDAFTKFFWLFLTKN